MFKGFEIQHFYDLRHIYAHFFVMYGAVVRNSFVTCDTLYCDILHYHTSKKHSTQTGSFLKIFSYIDGTVTMFVDICSPYIIN